MKNHLKTFLTLIISSLHFSRFSDKKSVPICTLNVCTFQQKNLKTTQIGPKFKSVQKSLLKKLKFKKYPQLWIFWQNYKIIQYTTLGQKIFFNFQILFLTPFCNQKRYFRVFWPFYTQILTKNPKFQKYRKLWGFSQKYQMFRYITWGRNFCAFSDFVFDPFL